MNAYASIQSKITTLGNQFSEQEAWKLFRLAAFAEAVGWSLLIGGICLSRFVLHGNHDPITIAGQLHGLLFMTYLAACVVLAPSLHWSWYKSIVALAFSVPPYGSLLFERWAAILRRAKQSHDLRQVNAWGIIFDPDKLLAVQPITSSDWHLPGGAVLGAQDVTQALQELIAKQLGIQAIIGQLRSVQQSTKQGQPTLDLYFIIDNPTDFKDATTHDVTIEEVRWLNPNTTTDLQPEFLQSFDPRPVSQPEFV